jgi:hypothetical protein
MTMYADIDSVWDFQRSDTALFGNTIAGYAYASELAGPDGVHIHLWLPEDVADDPDKRNAVKSEACRIHDVVSISWSYVTPDVEAWFNSAEPPKGYIAGSLGNLIRWHAEGKGFAKAFWGKGERMTIDAYSLSALATVAENLNEENRARLAGMVARGPDGAQQAISLCFRLINETNKAAGVTG